MLRLSVVTSRYCGSGWTAALLYTVAYREGPQDSSIDLEIKMQNFPRSTLTTSFQLHRCSPTTFPQYLTLSPLPPQPSHKTPKAAPEP